MIKFIHKFVLSREHPDSVIHTIAVNPIELQSNINVSQIAIAIEKASIVLNNLRAGGILGVNTEAIATWERILASLQHKWMSGMIEVQTNGHYTFE